MNIRTRVNGVLRLAAVGAMLTMAVPAAASASRQPGPCDIYGTAGTPCVAAHSTTRALYTSYKGALYRVTRQSDGKALDVGIEADGYADAAAQDAFCAQALCTITLIYDQSGKGNHLYPAPPGTFKGPAKGAFNTQPIADMAPITIGGHKAYGVYIMPGMGFRNNNATGIAIEDESEGIYYVIDGTHYDSGCCFDYGNSSTNGRAVGTGTMETTYFGTATAWGSGNGPGPWIMSDMEAGLFSGYNAKQNAADPTIDSWRFVTAVVDGGGGNKWDLRGGNAQKGGLTTFYSGIRPGSQTGNAYLPMHKQGGILLGTGGDNGNGSSGTFYEGVMTTGYPTEATTDAVQANIVAARYDVPRVSVSRVRTFTPGSSQDVTVTFTNTTGSAAASVKLSISVPAGWTAGAPRAIVGPVGPGASVSGTFKVASAAAAGAGFLTGKAGWTTATAGGKQFDTTAARVRNVLLVKINEVRFGAGAEPANQFIELYNASAGTVDLSGWTLIHAHSQWAPVRLAAIPAGTKLAAGGFYLLGLSSSGLAAPTNPGETTIHVRSTNGFASGQKIDIDGEVRNIVRVGTAAAPLTTLSVPVSTGPWITIPAGATNLPVTSAAGFEAGQKIGIDIGGNYELATVTAVGKPATQTTLAAAAVAGATNITVVAGSNIMEGDTLTVGTGGRKELVRVASAGTGVNLAAPLKFDHMPGLDVSDTGTGVSFSPATKFAHRSGDAVQALGGGIALDRPLAKNHSYGATVLNPSVATAGYQGPPAPNQWFGGPLSTSAGSIALLDAGAVAVVDAMVYGSQQSNSSGNGTIASPEIATLVADQGQGGCIVVVPGAGRGPVQADASNRSVGRFPDGADTGSLCQDFLIQPATTLPAGSPAGATNLKVAGVAGFDAGQTITIDTGANLETAVIAMVGTAGATTAGSAIDVGATVIAVANTTGFTAGQSITVDSGGNQETGVVASATGGRGGARITLAAPLTRAHAAGSQISGTGVTLTAALSRAHAGGTQVASSVPTPGAPNKYYPRR
ncbi:MAG: arabinofuranosidase catalytic domain-containing protein [Candidatus Sulfopaludibacter sp.]|nr:arabinofuranosidase catalytic domain-containing protein [Candidatus Sulfopaludibacter sp.]